MENLTAEQIIDEIQQKVSMGPYEYLDYHDCVRAMKAYAKQAIQEVLKRAAENTETHDQAISILNTEYHDLLK